MVFLDIFKKNKDKYNVTNRRIHAMHGHVQQAFNTVHDNVSTVHNSIGALNADIAQQKEWLKYLHQHHLSLKDQQASHREITKGELTKLNSWITFLHKSTQKQEKHLAKIHASIQETMQVYDTQIRALAEQVQSVHRKASERLPPQIIEKKIEVDHDVIKRAVLDDLNVDLQALRTELKQDLHETLTNEIEEKHSEHRQSVQELLDDLQNQQIEVQQPAEPQIIEKPVTEVREIIIPSASLLTNPEQKLLNLLINEADPLSYSKIGQLTGHSINTVRVNMNVLKKKGLIEESTLPSGVKLFSVTSKEKVRKMYNLQVL